MSVLRGLFIRKDATRGTTPVEARNALQAVFPTAGVVDGLAVTGVSSAWYYRVAAGHAVVSRGGTDGVTVLTVDGATDTPLVAVAPATGSRWDLIWIRHNDIDSGDADSNAVLGVTQGTAGGSPSKPYGTVPVGALVLAEANVAAGATGTLHANVVITWVAATASTRAPVPVPITGITLAPGWSFAGLSATRIGSIAVINFTVSKSSAFANGDVMFGVPADVVPAVQTAFGGLQTSGGAPNPVAINFPGTVAGSAEVYGQTGSNTQVRGSLIYKII